MALGRVRAVARGWPLVRSGNARWTTCEEEFDACYAEATSTEEVSNMNWKKGRGKPGVLDPLLGM